MNAVDLNSTIIVNYKKLKNYLNNFSYYTKYHFNKNDFYVSCQTSIIEMRNFLFCVSLGEPNVSHGSE